MPNKRIVITGIGPITSIGIGKETLWQGLINGRTNVKKETVLAKDEPWDS
jgi:3-oxoacyl-[acyl-carrier-protein] synthase II